MAANPVVPQPTLTIDARQADGATIVTCIGKITSGATGDFKRQVKALIPGSQRLVLDLGQVAYMDSAGLGTLVGLYISCRAAGCELKLANVSGRVLELLRITKVLSVFEGYGEYL